MALDKSVLDEEAIAEIEVIEAQPNIEVHIAPDKMSAYVSLRRSTQEFHPEDIISALHVAGVKFGINNLNIKKVIENEGFIDPVPVAVGVEPVPAVQGHFEYFFEVETNKTPVVQQDGSVDYLNVNAITMVEEGDVIAKYVPAKQGRPGKNVLGQDIPVKRIAELPPLRGTGFKRSEDGSTYTASQTGKIIEDHGRIAISNVYELFSDADISTGNIEFRGDVIIHGAVRDGITIKSGGTVTVDQIVEGATIEAGGDIILKQGLVGNSKARVKCKGNLTAKFIEFCYVEVEGDIHAESFMESEIYCYGKVILDGRKSRIIGGTTAAIEGIVCEFIGNPAGVPTWVRVGVDADLKYQLMTVKKKIEATRNSIKRVEDGLAIITRMEAAGTGDAEENKSNRMQLMRVKIRDSSILSSDLIEQDRLENLITKGQGVAIMVRDTAYAGVHVKIGDKAMQLKSNDVRCAFVESDEGVKVNRY